MAGRSSLGGYLPHPWVGKLTANQSLQSNVTTRDGEQLQRAGGGLLRLREIDWHEASRHVVPCLGQPIW